MCRYQSKSLPIHPFFFRNIPSILSHPIIHMQNIDSATSKFEDIIEKLASPVKPYLPALARFLLVVTFLEDSVRIT